MSNKGQFTKGMIPWNKGKKCAPSWNNGLKGFKHSGSFKPGHKSFLTKESIEKIRKSNIGRKLSDETKNKISKANKGKKYYRENNPCWRGGRHVTIKGYVFIRKPHHPNIIMGGYIFEHRLVIEKYIKRYLGRKESVHHLDEIKSNNAPNNLMAFTSESAHQRFHKDPNNVKPEEIIFDGRIFKILD